MYWRQLQRAGAVTREGQHEELPRGRVNHSGELLLFADKCILIGGVRVTCGNCGCMSFGGGAGWTQAKSSGRRGMTARLPTRLWPFQVR